MSVKVKTNGFFSCLAKGYYVFFKNYVEIEFKLKKGNYVGTNYSSLEAKKSKSGRVAWCDSQQVCR